MKHYRSWSINGFGCMSIVALTGLLITASAYEAHSAEFRTNDPLKAFVYDEYAVGDDYFIRGKEDTYIFRCSLTEGRDRVERLAFSEISIWGNRTGPWEVFRKAGDGSFVYDGTRHLSDTSCLESCRSKDYLLSGQCLWRLGWPIE